MNILVLGLGAVGSVVSYHLEKSGQAQVTTVSRSKSDAAKHGIRIESDKEPTSIVYRPSHILSTPSCASKLRFDVVIVATKCCPDIQPVSAMLEPLIPKANSSAPAPVVVVLQGGVGTEDEVQLAFPHVPILSGVIHASLQAQTVPQASELREGVVVKVAGAGAPMQLGLFEGWPGQGEFLRYRHWHQARHAMDLLKAAFDHGQWPTEICEDIFTARYTKNMFDCSLGAVGAVCRSPDVPSLFTDSNRPITLSLMAPILDELVRLGRHLEHDKPMPLADSKIAIFTRMKNAGSFPPSRFHLLDDLQCGRSLEVEPLLGNLVRAAKALELDLPYLRYVYVVLKTQQKYPCCAEQRCAHRMPVD